MLQSRCRDYPHNSRHRSILYKVNYRAEVRSILDIRIASTCHSTQHNASQGLRCCRHTTDTTVLFQKHERTDVIYHAQMYIPETRSKANKLMLHEIQLFLEHQ